MADRDRMKDQDTHYRPEPRTLRGDNEYPTLDANDVWFYQNELERHIRVSSTTPDRLIQMLWHLGAQARRAIQKEDV